MPQTIDNLIATWANSSTTFTALKMNVQGPGGGAEQSAAGSLLMDLQVGGSSRFRVSKDGGLTVQSGATIAADGGAIYFNRAISSTLEVTSQFAGNIRITSAIRGFEWSDLFLTRRAAANLRLGAADAAGSAIAINSVASNQLTLASNHGLTTGAAVIITGTAAPTGTTLNVRYYARVIAAAVIELYSTYDQATAASGTSGIIAVTTAGTSASVRLATPFQSFGVQDFTGTDIPGQPFIIRGSRGTGTGPGGDIVFQVAPAGTAGSSQNALATALTINSDRSISLNGIAGNAKIYDGGFLNSLAFSVANGTFGFAYNATYGFLVNQGSPIAWASSAQSSPVLALWRDADNTLALRNGANGQSFRVYNTTDGTNSEFGFFSWSETANRFSFGTSKAGSGTERDFEMYAGANGGQIQVDAAGNIYFNKRNTGGRWTINTSGHFLAGVDNTYDIGATSTGRPRNVYVASSLTVSGGGNDVAITNTGQISFASNARLKRSSTTLQVRNGGDTDFTNIQGKITTETAYTAGAPTATGYLILYDSNGTAYRVPAVLN